MIHWAVKCVGAAPGVLFASAGVKVAPGGRNTQHTQIRGGLKSLEQNVPKRYCVIFFL